MYKNINNKITLVTILITCISGISGANPDRPFYSGDKYRYERFGCSLELSGALYYMCYMFMFYPDEGHDIGTLITDIHTNTNQLHDRKHNVHSDTVVTNDELGEFDRIVNTLSNKFSEVLRIIKGKSDLFPNQYQKVVALFENKIEDIKLLNLSFNIAARGIVPGSYIEREYDELERESLSHLPLSQDLLKPIADRFVPGISKKIDEFRGVSPDHDNSDAYKLLRARPKKRIALKSQQDCSYDTAPYEKKLADFDREWQRVSRYRLNQIKNIYLYNPDNKGPKRFLGRDSYNAIAHENEFARAKKWEQYYQGHGYDKALIPVYLFGIHKEINDMIEVLIESLWLSWKSHPEQYILVPQKEKPHQDKKYYLEANQNAEKIAHCIDRINIFIGKCLSNELDPTAEGRKADIKTMVNELVDQFMCAVEQKGDKQLVHLCLMYEPIRSIREAIKAQRAQDKLRKPETLKFTPPARKPITPQAASSSTQPVAKPSASSTNRVPQGGSSSSGYPAPQSRVPTVVPQPTPPKIDNSVFDEYQQDFNGKWNALNIENSTELDKFLTNAQNIVSEITELGLNKTNSQSTQDMIQRMDLLGCYKEFNKTYTEIAHSSDLDKIDAGMLDMTLKLSTIEPNLNNFNKTNDKTKSDIIADMRNKIASIAASIL